MARRAKSIPGDLQDVASALDRSVAATPDAEALVSRYARYSYRDLDAAINAGAAALAALGVEPGDRIAASAGNHVDIVIAFFAVQRLGAIWVGIARPLAAPEKAYQLQDSGARLLLADAAAAGQIAAHRAELPALEHVIDMEPGETPNAWLRLVEDYDGARAAGGRDRPARDPPGSPIPAARRRTAQGRSPQPAQYGSGCGGDAVRPARTCASIPASARA